MLLPNVTDTLLTFHPSEAYQPCRWAYALPSCAFEPRAIPPEEVLTRFSRRSKVSTGQSLERTPKSPPNPLEVAHLLSSLHRIEYPPRQQADWSSTQDSVTRTQPPQKRHRNQAISRDVRKLCTRAWTHPVQAQNTPETQPETK